MIARPFDGALALITQPDHAHLARRIMDHCVALAGHPRRADILHAVGEHDIGWAEPDGAPVVDPETSRLADFVRLPLPDRQDVWRRGVARLAGRPWSAALVAHHAVTVYDRYRADRAWDEFERAAFGGWTLALDGDRVIVAPDVFGGATVPVEVEARGIPDRAWPDDAALRAAVSAARPLTIRGEMAGTP